MPNVFPTSISSPSIYDFTENTNIKVVSSESESGVKITRRRSFAAKGSWSVAWAAMPYSEYVVLKTFFNTVAGDTFSWTNPLDSISYTVRFADDTVLPAQVVTPSKHMSVSFTLEEA